MSDSEPSSNEQLESLKDRIYSLEKELKETQYQLELMRSAVRSLERDVKHIERQKK